MSLGNFAYAQGQRSYSFPHAGIGRLPSTTSVTRMPGIPCEQVAFQAHPDNTGNVFIGTGATMKPTQNIVLEPGKWSPYFPIQNLDLLYYYCADATSYLSYMLVK